MDKTIYLNDIEKLLKKCQVHLNNEYSKIKQTKTQTQSKKPFILKSFQSMYQKFLYKRNSKKQNNNKEEESVVIQSFDELLKNEQET